MGSRVVILHGAVAADAPPDEQDVLVEVGAVGEALRKLGFDVHTVPMTMDLDAAARALRAIQHDLVFNLVESVDGRGQLAHLAPALLQSLGLRYTGSPLTPLFASSDKLLAKRLLSQAGLATPPLHDDASANGAWRGPWIVKSVWEHASIGLDDASVVTHRDAASARIAERQKSLGGEWYAEAYIDGREINAAMLEGPNGPEVLPLPEIRFENFPQGKPRIVGYDAKWNEDSFECRHTVRSFVDDGAEPALTANIASLARRCWALFGLRGYARVDFRIDENDRPWVLEINANPCLSPDAGFAAAAARAGIDYSTVIERIVATAQRTP